ncbi:MAG: hypothetical protein RR128_05370 [Clostridium sp.]
MKKNWENPELKNLSVGNTNEEKIFECKKPVGNKLVCPLHNHLCKYAKSDIGIPYTDEKCIGPSTHVVRCGVEVVKPPIS